MPRQGQQCKGHTIPYGTFSGANPELSHAYYYFGYRNDEDIPPLPCLPIDVEECFDPEEDMQKKEMVEVVRDLLDSLSPRESKVLRLRFGFDCPEFTLEEIGNIFDLSRERIRQIESRGLRKFKKPERLGILLAHLHPESTEEKYYAIERRKKERERNMKEAKKIIQKVAQKNNFKKNLKEMAQDTAWVNYLKDADPTMYAKFKKLVEWNLSNYGFSNS
jgi:hypothetical protein